MVKNIDQTTTCLSAGALKTVAVLLRLVVSLRHRVRDRMADIPNRKAGHWNQSLVAAMRDPKQVIDADDEIVILKDKYPKARYHFLVLPRKKIQSIRDITKNDLDLLKHMQEQAERLAERADQKLMFRYGYHAIPSMSHLHMHVISQDFNSTSLKTKKHWNSFNTPYFIDSDVLIHLIETTGHIRPSKEEMSKHLKEDLRCHICHRVFDTIPFLKDHIVLHNVCKDSPS